MERDCNQTQIVQPMKITKSISTSTEDIVCTILKEDKSTSTEDLETFEDRTESVESSDAENNDQSVESEFHSTSVNDESDNICAGPEYRDTNLTDATKVQFLQSQLLAIQTQSVQERRKFSETRRYWTDPVIANNLGLNELQRASSSPSLLGEWRITSPFSRGLSLLIEIHSVSRRLNQFFQQRGYVCLGGGRGKGTGAGECILQILASVLSCRS